MAKTKAPSGLTVTRNDRTFTLSWKQGETYEAQYLEFSIAYYYNADGSPKWKTKIIKVNGKNETWREFRSLGVSANATSASLTVSEYGISALGFVLRGKASGKTVSGYSRINYIITAPNPPEVSVSAASDTSATFNWKATFDNTTPQHFAATQWQHALAANCNTGDGNAVGGWSGINVAGAEGSWTCDESSFDTIKNSYTRWIRVRSTGWVEPGLISPWRYARRVYAHPNPATNVSASHFVLGGSGYAVTVNWNSPSSESRPIDSISIEYVKATPVVTVVTPEDISGTVTMSMSCPTHGLSWSSVLDTGGYAGGRTASFTDPDAIPEDDCFYVRIANKHDNNITRSTPVLASGGIGNLKQPSDLAFELVTGTENKYSISVTRETSIKEAAIAVYFRSSSKQDEFRCIGMIQPEESSTTVIIPDFPEGDSISFGVQSFIGNYTPQKAPLDSTSATNFSTSMQMSSDILWGGEVPLPPKVTADAANESTISVTWSRSWNNATHAELSWADHEDAWESTNEPQTYLVSNVAAGKWNIAGLSVGTYYVRVRLARIVGESTSYSAYGPMRTVKLASSPDIPSLLLSSGVISAQGAVTCYWAYVSGDGTGQKQAQIFEAFPTYEEVTNPTGSPYDNGYYERIGESEPYKYIRSIDTIVVSGKTYYQTTGNITYGTDALRSTESAQHITLNAEEFGWQPGETHHLVVRVMSMSGESSQGFSAPVSLTIADELKLDILSSNLEYVNVPSEFDVSTGEPTAYRRVFSMTEFPLTFALSDITEGSKVTCILDRAAAYQVERPDESEYEGFAGETVLMKTYDTNSITVTQDDLIGNLDDGAAYHATFILSDAYGQNVQATYIPTGVYNEVTEPVGNPQDNVYYVLVNEEYVLTTDTEVIEGTTYYTKEFVNSFEIHWTHQAVKPSATIEIDKEKNVTFITPIKPETGFETGDVVDIYRLSADAPELIYAGAILTDEPTTYVDPYPAIGDFGGHRIVYRTYNGDYITEDNGLAMVDYMAGENEAYKHTTFGVIIDFNNEQLVLPGNVSFSNKWSKDFTLTKYLGGSVQGDWNPAVERSMSAKVTIPVAIEPENIETIRRLSVYPGVCHVRTPDGSSFAANIEVNEDREEKWTTKLAKVSLDITRCEPEGTDAKTYEDWQSEQNN